MPWPIFWIFFLLVPLLRLPNSLPFTSIQWCTYVSIIFFRSDCYLYGTNIYIGSRRLWFSFTWPNIIVYVPRLCCFCLKFFRNLATFFPRMRFCSRVSMNQCTAYIVLLAACSHGDSGCCCCPMSCHSFSSGDCCEKKITPESKIVLYHFHFLSQDIFESG